jgi:large subunit ribosomal protein L24
MSSKIHIKKGDTIAVITGDSKGKHGRVLSIDVEKERAIVEGVNLISKHTKPNAKSPQGGIVKKEAPIHVSNLMLVDASGKPSRKAKSIKK